MTIQATSLEYIKVSVAKEDGTSPMADPVYMAFMSTDSNPSAGDWKTASWTNPGNVYYARCLVGPGGTVTLAAGYYSVFVKVTDSPEVPVRKAGYLEVK
jgi:hypothetical protein